MKQIMHAAKIPEQIETRDKFDRMITGDLQYVNACDNKPWVDYNKTVSKLDIVPCAACMYIMNANREARKG